MGWADGARESVGALRVKALGLLLALAVGAALVVPAVAVGQGDGRGPASVSGTTAREGTGGHTNAGGSTTTGLTVNVTGEGIVTYSDGSPPCTMTGCTTDESAQQLVFLTATPAQGYTFEGWTAGCVGSGTVCGVTPAQDPVVSAQFVHAGAFHVTVSGPGMVVGDDGAVTCGMGHGLCSDPLSGSGTTQFTATGAPGAVFVGWGGVCAQFATDPCTVDNSAFSGATAAFAPSPSPSQSQSLTVTHTLPVASAPDALDSCLAVSPCITSVPGGSFYTLTAGGSFISSPFRSPLGLLWSGACVGSWPVCDLVVDSPTAVNVNGYGQQALALSKRGSATVTLTVMVTGRGRLQAVRGTLSPKGCGARPRGGGYSCTLSEVRGAFKLRATPVGHNRFRRWGSSMYQVCRPANRENCFGRVSYEGPDLAANFSGG
jgi:uncharacterized repeat protein (TIGR02543 family)